MSPLHPPKEQLIAFGQGRLAPEESVRVEEHLEGCHDCCETLLDLTDDTFVELLKFTKSADAPEQPVVATRRPARGLSEPGTTPDHPEATSDESAHSATVLVQSGEPVVMDELPAELRDHPRYRIVELIGRGGMGHVYRAEHRLMNRPVAIKLISSQLVRHPHAVERFRREVQAAAKLSHPNIVTAYDAEQAGDVHFLVMEFVEGTDLASIVKQRGPMSVAEAYECIRQAAVGLQHAHEKGMVHRDIKPHNLMLAAGGQVRILDFGLAGFASEATFGEVESSPVAPRQESRTSSDSDPRVQPLTDDPAATRNWLSCRGATGLQKTTAHLTTMGSVMGTPDYMAPEQAANAHAADIRADIYSLGCTLHFLLTGQPPFEADNVLMKLKAHAEEPPPSLTTLRKDVPEELSRISERMLAKDPVERFQTPAEVVEALTPFAQPASVPPRRRSHMLITAVLAGVALLSGLVVVATGRGLLEIQSEVDDVQVLVEQNGEQVTVLNLTTGSQVKWLPSGDYELKLRSGDASDIRLDQQTLTISRLGRVIVTARWNSEGRGTIASFNPPAEPVTRDGVEIADDGWKITATDSRTVQLFEAPLPPLAPGPFLYRAKLKTENVKGRAFLEMWVRFPGTGEFFSKGFHNAVTGTNGWAEYEIPFYLKKGQQPDQARLNLVIEGGGTVWIKDLELHGRTSGRSGNRAASAPGPVDPTLLDAVEQEALQAAEEFLAVLDADKFDQLFDIGSTIARKSANRDSVVQTYQMVRKTIGKLEKRTLQRVQLMDEFIGLPPGRYAAVQYRSDFEKHKGLWETILLNVDDDGQWRANTYAAMVQPLPLPESDTQTASASRANEPRTGLLTNPPKLPEGGLPVGRNLIVDPSLEVTPTGQLPNGWFAWLNDGPDFKCEVVEGGFTGKHCLQISGTGTRGVVFATSIPLDRTKRFALKGRVKVEGEAGTWAVIKLNYFNNTGWLGVDDRVGVTSSDLDWTFFEKTDAAERYPAATLLVPTCHIEGNGTAWFDDLEVVAYDREKLPADFDAMHGKNNRMK